VFVIALAAPVRAQTLDGKARVTSSAVQTGTAAGTATETPAAATPAEDTPLQPQESEAATAATAEQDEAATQAPAAETTSARVAEVMAETEDDDPFFRNDPKPKSGLGTIIPGWVLVGIGVVNLATSPICRTSAVEKSQQDLCFNLSIGVAIGGAAIGIPLLIVGYNQRAEFNEWKARHPNATWLLNTQVALTQGGAAVLYNGTF
jgi:uncharacterized membrane protein